MENRINFKHQTNFYMFFRKHVLTVKFLHVAKDVYHSIVSFSIHFFNAYYFYFTLKIRVVLDNFTTGDQIKFAIMINLVGRVSSVQHLC